MESLIEIQSRIAKLEQQAGAIRVREFDSTMKDILTKMNAFGITVKDLQAKMSAGKSTRSAKPKSSAKPVKSSPKKTVAAKYIGPNGEEWSGRGLTPRWLKAEVEQGKKKEDFLVKP